MKVQQNLLKICQQNLSKVCLKRDSSSWGNLSLGTVKDPQPWEKLKIGVIGAPLKIGQPHQGVSKSPDLLRNCGAFQQLQSLGHEITDFGNVASDQDEARNPEQVLEFNRKLSELVERVLNEDKLCITLGGDHAIGIGTISGFTRAFKNQQTCLLWIDAHADINTVDTSDSGNMHGMPVSFNLKQLTRRNAKDLKWLQPRLAPHRMAFIGLRCVDPEERKTLNELKIPAFSMREVDQLGIREVTSRALDIINPDKKLPLHVSLDIDVLDPIEAPATGTRVPGGLTLREGLSLVEDIYDTGCLRALDLVEVNTDLADEAGAAKTLEAARRLILACLGNYRGGRVMLQN